MRKRNFSFLIVLFGCAAVLAGFTVNHPQRPEMHPPQPGMEEPSYEIFVKFGGINGEAVHAQHKGWCNALGFEHGLEREGGEMRSQRMMHSNLMPFTITKFLDKATPKLNEALLKGKVFPVVTVNLVQTGEPNAIVFMQYIFKNAVLTSLTIHGEPMHGQPLPMERILFTSDEITWRYLETDQKGKSKGYLEFTWRRE